MEQINALGGKLVDAFGIDVAQLVEVAKCGINKINVDTDIRMACTRNILRLFTKYPELKNSPSIGPVYEAMAANPKNVDPRNYVAAVMDAILYGEEKDEDVSRLMQCMKDGVVDACAPLLVQFGSFRKAQLVEMVTCEQMAERYKKAGI